MADQYSDWTDARAVFLVLDPGDGSAPYRLKHTNGALNVFASEPVVVAIRSGSIAVSTLTPLFNGWLDLANYEEVIFALWTDSGHDVTLVVETSEDGVHADVVQLISVASSGMQTSQQRAGTNPARYWRMSAHTDDPFPSSIVGWSVRGVPR